jgi:protocatechuate 3,4-dioxygenase beta subunit
MMLPRVRVLAIALGGAALIFALACWALRGGEPVAGVRSEPAPSAVERPSEMELAGPEGRAASTRDGLAIVPITTPDAMSSASSATGTLIVRAVDAADDSPLAGIELRVGRERGGSLLLATATTDARGEARFEGIEANTIIVEAARTPPHARAYGAAWLVVGETETLVVRMDAGSTVRGRVVDDLGTPLAGAEVELDDQFNPRFGAKNSTAPTPIAVTSKDGRFELTHLSRAPVEVWVVRGEMTPRSWASPRFRVRYEDALKHAVTELGGEPGVHDLSDVVIPRAGKLAGRVIDAHGAPIAGALVSTRDSRLYARERGASRVRSNDPAWPNPTSFHVPFGETVSDADGRFEFRSRPAVPVIGVWTADDRTQSFPLPVVKPGERLDDLELRLADASLLVLELVDHAGNLITTSHPRSRSGTRPRGKFWRQDHLYVKIRGDQTDLATTLASDPDGLFRVQVGGDSRSLASVRLELNGYLAVQHALTDSGTEPVRIEMTEAPFLRLRVRIEGDTPNDPSQVAKLELHACLADPALRRGPNTPSGFLAPCCGLGIQHTIPALPGATELELVVQADEPFYIAARRLGGVWAQTFGPWRPSSGVHEIVVPAADPETVPRPVQPIADVRLRVRVTDAKTSERLQAFLWLEDPASDPDDPLARGDRFTIAEPNSDVARAVVAGTWRLRVDAEGYRSPPTQIVELAAGTEQDLGTFELEPFAIVDVSITESDGSPLPAQANVGIADVARRGIGSCARTSPGGGWEFRAETPGSGFATIREWLDIGIARVQAVPFEYDGSGRLEIRLAPWCTVEVRCPSSTPLESECALKVEVRASDGSWEQGRDVMELSERASDPGVRRFVGSFAPGQYALRAQSLVRGDRAAEFSVPANNEGVVRVELR